MAYVHRFHPVLSEGSLNLLLSPVATPLSGTAHGEGEPGPRLRCIPGLSHTHRCPSYWLPSCLPLPPRTITVDWSGQQMWFLMT